ncbi:LENG9 [Branchiostoma lanceolatum]|uniref:LENG9 protein n=3 Tax=Branchiostoma lanceolatum TaxID=7740 RepID=A0A8K0AEF0_BRALA|nr:LENG9 [Branchiostoma lanceolatum]
MRYFLLNILLICPLRSLLVDASQFCRNEEFQEWRERLILTSMAGAVCEQENSERYPKEAPTIHVSSSEACNVADADRAVLAAHLEGVAKASVGEAMLHTLITEAKEFAASHVKDISRSPTKTKTSAPDDTKPVCTFFLEGKCRFGDNCFNRHPRTDATSKVARGVSEIKLQDRESPEESRESERKGKKKPPMRTALDVINRIQWDEDLPSKNFVIGYLDRFTGVQERPFDDFTWGDLSDAEIDDLAIPQHRIQYFKYHDEKVWDKNERLDNVFGSTGSDVTIHDVLQRYKKEDESLTVQEKEEGVQAVEEGPQEDEENSSDDDDVVATQTVTTPWKGQRLQKLKDANKNTPRKSKQTSFDRPNFFVAVRITDPDILSVAKEFQTCIFARSPVLDAALAPVEKLHVTLCTLRLGSQTELDAARRVLRDLKRETARLLPPTLVLKFRGVETFNNRVLFAAPEDNPSFRALAARVTSRLRDAGLNMAGSHDDYTPHLTLLNLSRSLCKEMVACGALSAEGVDPALYDRFAAREFGAQAVEELHLCPMGSTRHDGFYQCAASVALFEEN